MDLMSPIESMMLLAESPGQPMHVAGLQLFKTPEGAGSEFVRNYVRALRSCDEVQPLFRKHPTTVPGGRNAIWSSAPDVDLDYHVRHSALPGPGRVRELLELTSRLHSGVLDRHRPLWETHVVEGLNDGRFAVYTKIHHGLVDGISTINFLQNALAADELDRTVRAPWASPINAGERTDAPSRWQTLGGAIKSVPRLGTSTLGLARAALLEQQLTLPFRAPRTRLNVPIGGARRCAAQSWSLQRVKDVKNAAGVTVNDVVLAMCAGALRAYLADQDALPEKPLVAMVPVSLRGADEAAGVTPWSGTGQLGHTSRRPRPALGHDQHLHAQQQGRAGPTSQAAGHGSGNDVALTGGVGWSHGYGRPTRRRSMCASPMFPVRGNRCTPMAPSCRAATRCRSRPMGRRSTSPL